MNIRWGVLSLSLVFSTAATPARATIVRAHTVGQEGLLPDEEMDLDMAGAFVYDVQAPRLFTTLGLARDRSVTSLSPGGKSVRSSLEASTSLRAIGALGPLPFALRYTPRYREDRFRDPTDYDEVYTRSRADLGLILGLGNGERWKWALEPFYRDLYRHRSASFGTSESEEEEYGVKGSLLWGEKGSARLAVALEGGMLRSSGTNLLTGLTVNDFVQRSYGLSLVPELPLWGGMGRALLRATAHHSDGNVPASFLQERLSDLVLDAGLGLTLPAGAEGLWHTSFLFSRTDTDRENFNFGLPTYLMTEEFSQTGTWRLGAEKPIVPGVILMASVDLLTFTNNRFANTTQRGSSTRTLWYSGTTMGLGLQPTDALRIDFNFASITSVSNDGRLHTPSSSLDAKDKTFSAQFEVDYRF